MSEPYEGPVASPLLKAVQSAINAWRYPSMDGLRLSNAMDALEDAYKVAATEHRLAVLAARQPNPPAPTEAPDAELPIPPVAWTLDDLILLEWAEAMKARVEDALRYISSPTMGLPGDRDALDYVDEASEVNVRLALKACIRTARMAMQPEPSHLAPSDD